MYDSQLSRSEMYMKQQIIYSYLHYTRTVCLLSWAQRWWMTMYVICYCNFNYSENNKNLFLCTNRCWQASAYSQSKVVVFHYSQSLHWRDCVWFCLVTTHILIISRISSAKYSNHVLFIFSDLYRVNNIICFILQTITSQTHAKAHICNNSRVYTHITEHMFKQNNTTQLHILALAYKQNCLFKSVARLVDSSVQENTSLNPGQSADIARDRLCNAFTYKLKCIYCAYLYKFAPNRAKKKWKLPKDSVLSTTVASQFITALRI